MAYKKNNRTYYRSEDEVLNNWNNGDKIFYDETEKAYYIIKRKKGNRTLLMINERSRARK